MDFFGDVFGATASKALFEGLNRVVGEGLAAHDWFASQETIEEPVRLPWQAVTPEEQGYERQLRDAILLISQSPQIFLQDAQVAASELPADILASAGAVLEADEGLRQLRFRLVPKYCSEEQFWDRYFAAVERVKQQVREEQMWGDFDMLDADPDQPKAKGEARRHCVELPSMRQPANATDTASSMVLSGQSSASVHSAQTARHVVPVAAAKPRRIRCKQQRLEQGCAEQMVMSGDLGSQASSATDALLLSPRSVDSTATKPPAAASSLSSPAGPAPMALSPSGPFPLGPASMGNSPSGPAPLGTASIGNSPIGPFPLGPASMGSSPSGPAPLGTASMGNSLSGPAATGTVSLGTSHAGLAVSEVPNAEASAANAFTTKPTGAATPLNASGKSQVAAESVSTQQHSPDTRQVRRGLHLGPLPANQLVADQDEAHRTARNSSTTAAAAAAAVEAWKLTMPFKAANLQQLAQAVLDSKKVATMQQLAQQLQASTSSDRAASSQQLAGHRQLPASSSSSRHFASSDRAAAAAWQLFDPMHVEAQGQLTASSGAECGLVEGIAQAMCGMQGTAEMALLWLEVVQEVESHWVSARTLPHCGSAAPARPQHNRLQSCSSSVADAIARQQDSSHSAQEASAKQGAAALQALQQLAPRQVFEELFAVEAYSSLRSAAAAARQADDNSVLLSGLREVEGLTSSALNQLPLTRHQLTKLCQVFNKLEVMFQVAIEQDDLKHQTQQQAAWIASASQQCLRASSPASTRSADEDPTWSDLGYESWTLL